MGGYLEIEKLAIQRHKTFRLNLSHMAHICIAFHTTQSQQPDLHLKSLLTPKPYTPTISINPSSHCSYFQQLASYPCFCLYISFCFILPSLHSFNCMLNSSSCYHFYVLHIFLNTLKLVPYHP